MVILEAGGGGKLHNGPNNSIYVQNKNINTFYDTSFSLCFIGLTNPLLEAAEKNSHYRQDG